MREIRFRGKEHTGDWITGGFVQKNGAPHIMAHIVDRGVDEWRAIPVIPATVGQFTGLKDRNGVEIYEGDVLGFPNGPKKYFTVSIGDYSDFFTGFSQYGVYSTAIDDETVMGLRSNGAEMTVVIGNIFDNSELMKK